MKKRNVFVLGAFLGAAAVALLTPKSGKEMQKELLQKVDDVQTKIKDLDIFWLFLPNICYFFRLTL